MAHFEDCKFFLRGKCMNGLYCGFRHNEASLLTEQVCKRWAAGYTCHGRCNLRHPSAADLAAVAATPPPRPRKPQHQGQEMQRQLPGQGENAPTSVAVATARVCIFYLQGRCTKGSACSFSHATPAAGVERPPAEKKLRGNSESPAGRKKPMPVSDSRKASIAEGVQPKQAGNGGAVRRAIREDAGTPAESMGRPGNGVAAAGHEAGAVGRGVALRDGNGTPSGRKRGRDGSGSSGSAADDVAEEAGMTIAGQGVRARESQTPTSSSGSTAEARVCWFYSKGLCSKGSACLFSHATQPAGDRAELVVPPRREKKGARTSTLRMAAVEARAAARAGIIEDVSEHQSDGQHTSGTAAGGKRILATGSGNGCDDGSMSQDRVKAKAAEILRKHSLTKSKAAAEPVQDELQIAREKRIHAQETSSSEDESPSKRQRTTAVNGRDNGGVDGTAGAKTEFSVAAREGVSEESGTDIVLTGNDDSVE